jgi:dienelactone hydrolase
MHTETTEYRHGGVTFEGFVAHDEVTEGRRPGVLIAHAWMGQDDFARRKAEQLAELGYVGFAGDIYGKDNRATDRDGAQKLMQPLVTDRALLRHRMRASLDQVRAHRLVDDRRLGAIGFCFGGLCVLDLARSGATLNGVVAFHGLLHNAPDLPNGAIQAKILALHGWDDPMATPEQVVAFANEMTNADADWQLHAYGNTMHAFTNPEANDPAFGTVYDEAADRRSWAAMRAFFEEVFE